MAVVGAGHWGPNLIATLRDLCDVRWIVERDAHRASVIDEVFPTLEVTTELALALRDETVEAVVVATPTVTHREVVGAALTAGKHVLCEKPLSYDIASAAAMVARADERGLVLAVGHLFLYHPAVAWVKEYLASGGVGSVRYLSMVRTNLGPVRTDVNAAWDLASHDVSIANWWLDATPVRVSAVGGGWLNGVSDVVFATLEYPGERLVHVHVSWISPDKERRITVVGDERMVTFDDMAVSEPVRVYDKGIEGGPPHAGDTGMFRASVRDGEIRIPLIAPVAPLRRECEDFLSSVANRTRPLADGRRAVEVLTVLEALDRSVAAGGKPVSL